MKAIVILFLFLPSFFQNNNTIEFSDVPLIKIEYFWGKDLNLKLLKTKSNTLIDTIKNGYYGDQEYLTFVNKKLNSIRYTKNGVINSVITLVNGNGYLRTKNDSISFQNGMLNGKSYFYHYYPTKQVKVTSPSITMSSEPDRHVVDFKDNFVKSLLIYRKGILIYESYYKNFDFIKYRNNNSIEQHTYCDGLIIYNNDGSFKSSRKYKNGRVIK
jgi:hypothetical protein